MHKPRVILATLFFVLPIVAQSDRTLPPEVSEFGGSLIPPHDNNSILARPQVTGLAGRTLYRWSVAAVLAGSVADAASGWRAEEANPVVAGTGKQFGVQSVAIKSGFVGASLLIQYIALRHRPDLYKRLAWMNLITAGALGGIAGHNVSVR